MIDRFQNWDASIFPTNLKARAVA